MKKIILLATILLLNSCANRKSNVDINKQKDGCNIKFENWKYYLYEIDMGMGRAGKFEEARNKEIQKHFGGGEQPAAPKKK